MKVERKRIMRGTIRKISLLLLIASMLLMSSCMKVHIMLPSSGITINTAGGNGTVAENTTAANQIVLPDASAPEVTTKKPEEASTSAPVINEVPTNPSATVKKPTEMTKSELLDYFNLKLNTVKEEMPAFKKSKLTTVSDIKLSNSAANTLVGFVKGALLSEEVEETPVEKGSPCIEIMSPDGERFVSQLTEADIKDITVTEKGGSYEVTVTLNDALNPNKTDSAYGKIFNFITVDDVVSKYAPKVGATVERSNIKVNYSGSYARATFTADGRVENYYTYVSCVMSLIDATVKKVVTINTDVEITLVSTTEYTNFSY